MTGPFAVSATSGSAPSLPTNVRRASWDGRVVEKARCDAIELVEARRRAGVRRKDIVI
jgi:hypothetical protein